MDQNVMHHRPVNPRGKRLAGMRADITGVPVTRMKLMLISSALGGQPTRR